MQRGRLISGSMSPRGATVIVETTTDGGQGSARASIPRALLAVALAVAALRLAVIWTGRAEGSLLADDAYYYFTLAHHIAHGAGATFDTLTPTNGFHPLWQLLLVPLFAVLRDDPFTPVRASLSLALVFDLASAALLWRLAGRLGGTATGGGTSRGAGRGAAWAAPLLWLLCPVPFVLGLRGMEASLSALLTLAVLEARVVVRPPWWVGLMLGLAALTRTDNLLVLGAALAVTALAETGFTTPVGLRRSASRGARPRAPSDGRRDLAITAGVAGAMLVPWVAWSWWRVGTPWQSSALMKWRAPDLFGALPDQWSSLTVALSSAAHAFFAPLLVPLRFLAGEEMSAAHWSWPLLAGVLLPTVVLLAMGVRASLRSSATPHPSSARSSQRTSDRPRHEIRTAWFFLATATAAHVVLFGLVGRNYATWYAQPTWALWALALALAAAALWSTHERVWVTANAALLGLTFMTAAGLAATELHHVARWPEKRFGSEFASLAERIRRAGPGPRWQLGAFDAGVRGWVALRHEEFVVVNLDGLVNNEVVWALEEDRYVDYVRQTCDALLQKPERAATFLPQDRVRRLKEVMGTGERRPEARARLPQ